MATKYAIEEALSFCIEYIQKMKSTRRRMWDGKVESTMHDEILEGNMRPCRLGATFKGWTHIFVLNNATTIQPQCN
jgi:hypothetical protein